MFRLKNLSSTQLSLFTTLVITIPLAILFSFLVVDKLDVFLLTIIIFVLVFSLIRFVIEWFIYRKIKLIYKLIFQTKANRKEEMYNKYILPKKTIDDVKQDVENWAAQQKNEIEVLKSNEAYRKEFLQNLAHEFKTPIFAIQGYVDTLINGAIDNPAVNKKFLENASKNVQRMVNLINDLDEITRLESGEQPLIREIFIIQDLIKDVFESLSITLNLKNISTAIKKGCEAPVQVFADKKKILQVLLNLIENAIKYGKKNGNIIASVYKADNKHVLIEISDDGVGIAEEHISRVFERFYRTDRGRSRDVGGTGLGLSICKHIIEAHNQTIHIRSKIGVGTTVGFTLAAKKEE